MLFRKSNFIFYTFREAACQPAGGSLIAEMFDPSTRGVATGIFHWGIYIGNGLTFVLGNYLPWRVAFFTGCTPGLLAAAGLWFLPDPRKSPKIDNVGFSFSPLIDSYITTDQFQISND